MPRLGGVQVALPTEGPVPLHLIHRLGTRTAAQLLAVFDPVLDAPAFQLLHTAL